MILVHDGAAIRPAAEARVPVLDHGFLFGDSVYEVVRTAHGRLFMLTEHLDRMRRSAAMIYFVLPWTDAEIESRLEALRAELGTDEAYFRIIATRGPGPISLLPDECAEPGLYLIGRELIRYPERMYTEGCSVAIVPRLRNDPRALDPRAKTGNYLNNMLGLIEARRAGADDALFLNAELHLTEGTTSNAWIVEDGRVVTPPLAEEVIDLPRLGAAAEVFLSGTVKGIMPVTVIDGEPVGDGCPGPVAARAAALYEDALGS
jgi:branched-chain amino acid aminotransferase